MKPAWLKGSFSNPFDKRDRAENSEEVFWTNRRIKWGIRCFSVLFVFTVSCLIVYRFSNRPLSFEEKLVRKEAVYLPIKEAPFRLTDPATSEEVVSNPAEKERVYRTQLYSMGNIRYRAATVYWDLSDIPEGTTYKQVSPFGAIKELMESDRYDGVVFMIGKEQAYYARSTFEDLILKLKLKQAPSVRIKES